MNFNDTAVFALAMLLGGLLTAGATTTAPCRWSPPAIRQSRDHTSGVRASTDPASAPPWRCESQTSAPRDRLAPRAFLVVPLVGAFFIDFANAIIITFFVNWLR